MYQKPIFDHFIHNVAKRISSSTTTFIYYESKKMNFLCREIKFFLHFRPKKNEGS